MDSTPDKLIRADQACTRSLGYFGIFRYPLTADEVHRFATEKLTSEETLETLERLTTKNLIFKTEEYYSLSEGTTMVAERKKGNRLAASLLEQARRSGSIIASFPYVRCVAVSGSLSKHHARENADIDYFIITESNRLWIARSLLHAFKKLTFLAGRQHHYCMNYFVDTSALAIPDQNLYAAVETVTMIPLFNAALLDEMRQQNPWTQQLLPNDDVPQNTRYLIRNRNFIIKQISEAILDAINPLGLNKWLMRFTDRKWRKKWKKRGFSLQDYERAFFTSEHVSKNHPGDYQKHVLEALQKNHHQSFNSQ